LKEFTKKISAVTQNKVQLQQMQQHARILAERKYSRKHLSENFVKIFSN